MKDSKKVPIAGIIALVAVVAGSRAMAAGPAEVRVDWLAAFCACSLCLSAVRRVSDARWFRGMAMIRAVILLMAFLLTIVASSLALGRIGERSPESSWSQFDIYVMAISVLTVLVAVVSLGEAMLILRAVLPKTSRGAECP